MERTQTVKAYLPTASGTGVEVRRIPLVISAAQGAPNPKLFQKLMERIGSTFPALNGKIFSLKWKDGDGDMIEMSTDGELEEALANSGSNVLKVFICVDGELNMADSEFEMLGTDSDASNVEVQDKKGNHDKPDPYQEDDLVNFQGPPHPFARRGRHGGRGRRGHGPFHPMFPHHGGPPHFVHGMPPPPHIGFEGRHGGVWGPPPHPQFNEGQGMVPPPPFGGMRRRWGPGNPWMEGRHGHHGHHEGHGMKGWKRAMKEAIPKPHRRWAKSFIRNWRQENLQDVTSTSSSDSEGGKRKQLLNREACGVPLVYQQWLEVMLPRWQSTWGGKKTDQEINKADKPRNQFKDEVPFQFRKWVRFFLMKHFGPRNSPKLCRKERPDRCGGRKHCHGKSGRCGQDPNMWRGRKVNEIRSAVPARQRAWAKRFILAWRMENKINFDASTFSDSDGAEVTVSAAEAGVHEDYAVWLRRFLPRWHSMRGLYTPKEDEIGRGGMGQFKDTVPMEFRRWVKFHLCRRYGRVTPGQGVGQRSGGAGQGQEAIDPAQYKMWLQAFKRQWIAEHGQQTSDSDGFYLTSSDDDAFNTDNEMEQELKKLRLAEGKKSVRFDPEGFTSDSDDGAAAPQWTKGQGKTLNPEFRKFAREALNTWDGQPPVETENLQGLGTNEQNIPPHVYNWMARKMVKMQMKKFCQQKKAMKKEMKWAVKQAKRSRRGF